MDRYLSLREAFLETAAPSIDSARRLARMTDEALCALAQDSSHLISHRTRWVLIALGGYGSKALLPASDLDLLIVGDAPPASFKPFVEALLYPLWDAGLKVGHQVRDKRDQARAVREDLTTLTATLTGRVLAGDESLGHEVLSACAKDAGKRSRTVLAQLRDRPRPGSPYLLEPDLKDGAGGRRDFDELTWTAALLSGRPQHDPSSLVELGILSAQEYDRLAKAAELTAAARWELQRAGTGPRLSLESAEESTLDLGRLQAALADTHHLLLSVRRRTDRSEAAVLKPPSPDDLFSLTDAGEQSLEALEQLAWAGLLEDLVPGMAELMTLRRPGLAHTLTVGAHCIKAACVIGQIGHRIDAGPVAARSAAALKDSRVAVTAALMHDVGKCTPGPDHALRGVEQAALTASRLGLGPQDAEDVGTLVRLHLLLIETATRADLDDEDSVLLAAGRLGRRELLPPLHLLSIADTIATGPGAWNEWTAALMGKLVTRLDSALSPDVDGAGIVASAKLVRAAALAALPDEAHHSRGFVYDAPLRYLAGRELAQVLEHAELVSELTAERAPGAHAVRIDHGPLANTSQVTVATQDRHGLLAILAGVLALTGLDILSVEAIGTRSGIALDIFTVRSATLAPLSTDTWSRFDRLLDAALRGRLSIGVRLSERRRHYRDESMGIDRVDVLPGDQYAASIRIRATDRVGLLYDVTRAMADSGLEIRSVTATTRHKTADDVFRVTDANGAIPEEGLLGMLRMRLRELE